MVLDIDQNILNLALDPVINFGKVTVSTGYTNAETFITLKTGDGNKLPDPSTTYNLVWWNWSDYPDPSDDPNVEIVRVIGRSGDIISIMRSQEDTLPTNKNLLGKTYKMILSQTKKTIGDIQTDAQSRVDTHSALITGVHGVGSDTVDGITARNTAISTHSALTSSVHNFDASGNSPPQIHGSTKHDSSTVDGGAALSSSIQIPLHDSSRHTGTIGDWSQIDKTTSDIADITTKSHTSLTDIGTSTHTQIDTHISSIIAHGVSAGLDASKSGSPVVGQRFLAVDTNKDYECFATNVWTDVTAIHAALTTSVHNFDASGNAPPQLHGLASHTDIIGDHQGNLTGIGTNTHTQIDSHISTVSAHGVSSSIVGTSDTQTLTNKTINDATNNVMARSLKSATSTIDISTSAAPSSGMVLTATSSTAASWQTPAPPPGPAISIVSENTFNQSATVGTSTLYARADHTHGTPTDSARTILPITTVTGTYTAASTDYTILANGTTTPFTITLPTAVGIVGKIYNIKKTDSSTNAITISATSPQTIDGLTSRVIGTQYETVTVQSDGTNWNII